MSDSDEETTGSKAKGERGSRGKATTERSAESSTSSRRRRPPKKDKPDRSGDLNPVWWVPVMCGLMIFGLFWLVACYLTQTEYPIPGIGNWNLIVGFATLMAGFLMTTRWR